MMKTLKKPKFVLIWGLSGSGKTTLCRKVAEDFKDIHYIDVDKDSTFLGDRNWWRVFKKHWKTDCDVLTEGCLPSIATRRRIMQFAKKTHDCYEVYLNPDLDYLFTYSPWFSLYGEKGYRKLQLQQESRRDEKVEDVTFYHFTEQSLYDRVNSLKSIFIGFNKPDYNAYLKDVPIFIEENKPWYQYHRFGFDYVTEGAYGIPLEKQMELLQFPTDLRSKTVLDIGGCTGSMAIEAVKCGAVLVDIIEKEQVFIDKGRKVFELMGNDFSTSIHYLKREIDNQDTLSWMAKSMNSSYDLVLCLSTLHNLSHQKTFINILPKLVCKNGLVIMETALEGLEDDRVVDELEDNCGFCKVFPTIECVQRELDKRFSSVEYIGFGKNRRAIFHCKFPRSIPILS